MNREAVTLPWPQIMDLAEALRADGRWEELLMIGMAGYTALRCSDWQLLKWNNFYTQSGEIRKRIDLVEKKTSKKRRIVLGEAFHDLLKECRDNMKVRSMDTFIFQPKRKKGQSLKTGGANWRLKKISKEYGLPDITTHTFRKSFGRHYYESNGKNFDCIVTLQRLFGHASPATTIRYIGVTSEQIYSFYQNLRLQK